MSLRRPLVWQVGAIVVVGFAGYWIEGVRGVIAVSYGGGIAILNVIMLYWRWYRGARRYRSDPKWGLKGLYRSSVERFFLVGILLAAWFAFVKWEPLAVLTGFIVGQVAGLATNVAQRGRV